MPSRVGRLLIEAIERVPIVGVAGRLAHLHAFAPGQPDVVAPLLVHPRQQSPLRRADIEHPRAARMGGIADCAGSPARRATLSQVGSPSRTFGSTLSMNAPRLRASSPARGAERGQRGRGGISHDGATRRVEVRAAQQWRAARPSPASRHQLAVFQAPRRSAALPSGMPQFGPLVRLGDVAGRPATRRTRSTLRGR